MGMKLWSMSLRESKMMDCMKYEILNSSAAPLHIDRSLCFVNAHSVQYSNQILRLSANSADVSKRST